MPSVAETHYVFDPRPPGRVPALGNDFLMHRFNSPFECCEDDICLNQIPKRANEIPTPGVAPDFYTGWGLHLEKGLDTERVFLLLLVFFVSSGIFGLVWAICNRSLQDGFSMAGWIVSGEAVAVATLQLLLTVDVI